MIEIEPWHCIVVLLILGYAGGLVHGYLIGRDDERIKRARRDLADANRMRTAIREYDDRLEQFAPLTISKAQSSLPTVGALTTASASLPPPSGR